jgi:hypothetical protein
MRHRAPRTSERESKSLTAPPLTAALQIAGRYAKRAEH